VPKQNIAFHAFGDTALADALGLKPPPFVKKEEAHRQIEYVQEYAGELGCQSLVIESHYIDRDYMEDHSVFYSKSLYPYPNSCQRIHFFSVDQATLSTELKRLLDVLNRRDFRKACSAFSERYYLGFSVIKPLPGCPVGRTVLRCFPKRKDKTLVRRFDCACNYPAHLLGVHLSVRGLAFQQQDLGVSACATTALWSALQRARELEGNGPATPAQITIRASQFALPFGRPMPSEKLSLDQMCQAVQSFGYAPNLFRADDFDHSRGLLYSSVSSGLSPVLILEAPRGDRMHAVTVAGMKVRDPHVETLINPLIDDRAGDLVDLYIHDDRLGPYLRAEIRRQRRRNRLVIKVPLRKGQKTETWYLTHILLPMHSKIRLSLGDLRELGITLVCSAHAFRESLLHVGPIITSWSSWITRSHSYLESLSVTKDRVSPRVVEELCKSLMFPRYVGVVRMEAADLDPLDLLVDTTSTQRNLNCLGIVQTANTRTNTNSLAHFLAFHCECPLFR